jgi:cytochrome c-type biogenesis protein
MIGSALAGTVLLPIGLGLMGFVEPCSLGSSLIVVKHLEGKSAAGKVGRIAVFAGTRALFMGLLGMLAAMLGTAFVGFQRVAWIGLGILYIGLGLLYLTGKAAPLMRSVGPGLSRLADLRGSAALGVLLGLNIPACAAPLLVALLGAAAAGATAGAPLASGFIALGLFGLALSLPLIFAVLLEPARRGLDWLAGLSSRLPFWTGLLLVGLGAWSIWLAV